MTKNEIKVILIGDSGVGKTNIIRLAIGKGFSSNQEPSLTLSFSRKEIKIKIKNSKTLENEDKPCYQIQ